MQQVSFLLPCVFLSVHVTDIVSEILFTVLFNEYNTAVVFISSKYRLSRSDHLILLWHFQRSSFLKCTENSALKYQPLQAKAWDVLAGEYYVFQTQLWFPWEHFFYWWNLLNFDQRPLGQHYLIVTFFMLKPEKNTHKPVVPFDMWQLLWEVKPNSPIILQLCLRYSLRRSWFSLSFLS